MSAARTSPTTDRRRHSQRVLIDGVSDWHVDNHPITVCVGNAATWNDGNIKWNLSYLNRDHLWGHGNVDPDFRQMSRHACCGAGQKDRPMTSKRLIEKLADSPATFHDPPKYLPCGSIRATNYMSVLAACCPSPASPSAAIGKRETGWCETTEP